MSSRYAELTASMPGLARPDTFDDPTSITSKPSNDSLSSADLTKGSTSVSIDIRTIQLLPVEELYAVHARVASKSVADLKTIRHLHLAVLGLSLTVLIGSVLVVVNRYWLLFFLTPILLGFVEMIITVNISKRSNGHR